MDNEIDYSNPEEVVSNFIVAMNEWELEANHLSKSGEGFDAIIESMNKVFDLFCTQKERPYGRKGSFQKPPEYDPKSESIVSSNIEKSDKAIVITSREAILGGGIYKYVLYKKSGKWLIDNIKFKENKGNFTNAIL